MVIFMLVMAAIIVCAAIGFFISNYFLWAEWLIALLATIVIIATAISVFSGIIWVIVCAFLLL